MLNLFPPIAIDIGSFAVKVIELGGKSHKTLKALGLELLPPETIVDGIIQDEDTLKDIIQSIFHRLKISPVGRPVSISLSGSGVYLHRIYVDTSQGDIDDLINYEAEQYFDTKISDIYYKYKVLEKLPNSPQTPVLLAGALRDMVDQHVSVLRDIGLNVKVVDCDTLCLLNMFDYNFPAANALVGLINIGANSTQIVFALNGQYLYSKEIKYGGVLYTTQMMDALGLTYENAEQLKISSSQSTESISNDIQKIISDINAEIINEIQTTINTFLETPHIQNNNLSIQYLFLTGGGAKTLGLETQLASTIKIPVVLLNPFKKTNIPNNFDMNYILSQGHLYSVAFGLGLRFPKDDV